MHKTRNACVLIVIPPGPGPASCSCERCVRVSQRVEGHGRGGAFIRRVRGGGRLTVEAVEVVKVVRSAASVVA